VNPGKEVVEILIAGGLMAFEAQEFQKGLVVRGLGFGHGWFGVDGMSIQIIGEHTLEKAAGVEKAGADGSFRDREDAGDFGMGDSLDIMHDHHGSVVI
jgi:hypothetical protein